MDEVAILTLIKISQYIGAALVMAVGAVGSSMAQGKISAKACESLAQNPNAEKSIRTIFFTGIIAIETSAIYCLLIALYLLTR
jgi:F-type H+-transporting ATPase subunit c